MNLIIYTLVFLMMSSVSFAQMNHQHHEGMDMKSEEMSPEEHKKMQTKGVEVMISKERQQLIGVKTEASKIRSMKKLIRTYGTVAYDPELYSAQNEYVLAVHSRDKARDAADEKVLRNAEELAEAVHLKLKRLGLSDDFIATIKDGDQSLIVGSDDGPVWIYGKIYETEAQLVKSGMMVHVTSKNLPGKMFMGEISSIDTVVDEATRSLKARSAVMNNGGLLKPNMYVDIMIESPIGNKLAVPEDAMMDTGTGQIVFVETADGVFERRNVVAGARADGFIEIIRGLKAGEMIVSSGTFMVDSESKLKSTGGGHIH